MKDLKSVWKEEMRAADITNINNIRSPQKKWAMVPDAASMPGKEGETDEDTEMAWTGWHG